MTFWVVNILNSLSLAMILFLLAAGLTLIYGIMHITNIAHGTFYLLGAYLAIEAYSYTQNFAVSAIVGVATMVVFGVVLHRGFLARIEHHELSQALLTLGVLFVFQDLAFVIWGGNPLLMPEPAALQGVLHFGRIVYPIYRLFLIFMGLLFAVLIWLLIEKTRIGAIVRAGMDDEEMVRGMGINIPAVATAVFALGAGLAAIGGILAVPLLGIYPGVDFDVGLLAFVVVTIGGLGSARGAFFASIIVGLVDDFGNVWFPQLSLFTIILPMIVILALRPRGLMGRA